MDVEGTQTYQAIEGFDGEEFRKKYDHNKKNRNEEKKCLKRGAAP